jgi:hypothetical protein
MPKLDDLTQSWRNTSHTHGAIVQAASKAARVAPSPEPPLALTASDGSDADTDDGEPSTVIDFLAEASLGGDSRRYTHILFSRRGLAGQFGLCKTLFEF